MSSGLVYFAHPIDQTSGNSSLVIKAANIALESKLNLYRPGTAYGISVAEPDTLTSIDRVNQAALRDCDSLLAVLPMGVPTLGTPVEIDRALSFGMPVVIVSDSDRIFESVQIQGWIRTGAMVFNVDTMPTDEDLRRLLMPKCPSDAMLIHRTSPETVLPTRAYFDDAGLDLTVVATESIPAGQARNLPTGLRVAIPNGHWGLIIGRSSTWHRHGLFTNPAVIDAGWRGELFVAVRNLTGEFVRIGAGTKLAQLIVLPAWPGRLIEVDELPQHPRGFNGFGSTG